MKDALIWTLVVVMLGAGLWFFHVSGAFLSDGDYLAGLLHIFVGLASVKAGVELARLAIVSRIESP